MFTGLFAVAILVAKFFPETPAGRSLHFYLVEEPMRLAARAERHHLLYLLILVVAGQAMMMAAPLELALIAAWDISIYLDAVIAVWTVSAVARGKGAVRILATWFVRRSRATRAKPGARRDRRTRKLPAPSNDPDERRWALAA